MSYANGTTHYNLPLTVGSDKRDWADTNQAFADLDAAVYGAVMDTGTQEAEISALETRMDTAEQNISGNASDIASLDARLTTAEGSITSQAAAIDDVRSDSEDMICAYHEATATSTHAYAIGDYFIYNDVLYRSIASIAIGDTIVPDTNCTTTNVTTELMSAGSDAVDMICTVTENTTTSTHNYSVDDYFILNNVLYKVTATITVGTTIIPGTNCTSTNVTAEITSDNNPVTNIAPAYSNTSTYVKGNVVSNENKIYQCTTAINTPEDFTPAHWNEISISDLISTGAPLNIVSANGTKTWSQCLDSLCAGFYDQINDNSYILVNLGTTIEKFTLTRRTATNKTFMSIVESSSQLYSATATINSSGSGATSGELTIPVGGLRPAMIYNFLESLILAQD